MSHPVQSNEPTMEEILASIRRIISDDDQAQDQQPQPAVAEAAPDETPRDESVSEEQDMAGQAKQEDDAGVFELTDEVPEAAGAADEAKAADAPDAAPEATSEEVVFAAEEANEEAMDKGFGTAPSGEDKPAETQSRDLLSGGSHQSVQQTFASLENFVMSTHARTLEDLVSEMMRPMLREWLDANLPPLTERLVREEIERVSRGRR